MNDALWHRTRGLVLRNGTIDENLGLLARLGVLVHEFKVEPVPFVGVWDGRKRFEWRDLRDRPVRIVEGDVLRLREWMPERTRRDPAAAFPMADRIAAAHYTGRELWVAVSWILADRYGVPPGCAVLGWIDPLWRCEAHTGVDPRTVDPMTPGRMPECRRDCFVYGDRVVHDIDCPHAPQPPQLRDCTCRGVCRGVAGLDRRYRCCATGERGAAGGA